MKFLCIVFNSIPIIGKLISPVNLPKIKVVVHAPSGTSRLSASACPEVILPVLLVERIIPVSKNQYFIITMKSVNERLYNQWSNLTGGGIVFK